MLIVIFVQRFTPYAFLGLRLSTLFTGRVSPWTGFKASVLCVGCNAVLPARMGELVKIVWLRACGAISYSTLCGGVFLERLLDVSTLLCLALVFALPQLNKTVVLTLAAGVGGLWITLLLLAHPRGFARRCLATMPLPTRVRGWALHLCAYLEKCVRSKIFFRALLGTALVWSMNYAHVALLANGLLDLHLTWDELGLLCVTLFFSSALMLAPGGVGLMEVAVVMVLSLMHVDKSLALSTALFARLFYSVPPLLGAAAVIIFGKGDIATSIVDIYQKKHLLPKEQHTSHP